MRNILFYPFKVFKGLGAQVISLVHGEATAYTAQSIHKAEIFLQKHKLAYRNILV